MTFQKQLRIIDDEFCFCVERVAPNSRGVVVLFNGLGQSKAEFAFFYTRLANWLYGKGFSVMQWDFRGTGDSSGNLENVTLPGMAKDVEMLAEDIRKSYEGQNVFLVGKGLGATLALLYHSLFPTRAIVQLSPYVTGQFPNLVWEAGLLHFSEIIKGFRGYEFPVPEQERSTLHFLQSLGGYPENLKGQLILGEFMDQLAKISLNQCDIPTLIAGNPARQKGLQSYIEAHFSQAEFMHFESDPYVIPPYDQDLMIIKTAEYLEGFV